MAIPSYTRDEAKLRKTGSGLAWFQEVDPDGTDLATPGPIVPVGYIKKSVYDRKPTINKETDQGGRNHTTGTTIDATMTMKIMQRDDDHLTMQDDLEDIPIRIFQELTDGELDGIVQILIVPNARIQPGAKYDGEDLWPEPVFDAKPTTASVIVDMTDLTDTSEGAGVGNATIPIGSYEYLYSFTPA